MENVEDHALSIRHPLLAANLGMRVGADYEGEEQSDTRSSVVKDANDVNLGRDWEIVIKKEAEMSISNGEDSNVKLDINEGGTTESRDRIPDETSRTFSPCKGPDNRSQDDFNEHHTSITIDDNQSSFTNSCQRDEEYDCIGHQASVGETQDEQVILSIDDAGFGTSSPLLSQRSRVTTKSSDPVTPLPNGKKYHVFFSYGMADRDWVHSVALKMESEHGYRCTFHERDFHGGKLVLENIDEHIQWSVKMILVLSPDFLESSWCQYEMKQGLHVSIEEARMLIVPVMVRECEVPKALRSLTYINATHGTDWWDRFLEAVTAEEELQLTHSRNEITIRPQFENFEYLCEMTSTNHGLQIKLDVPNTPAILTKPGIKISDKVFHENIRLLNKEMQPEAWLTQLFWTPQFTLIICVIILFFSLIGPFAKSNSTAHTSDMHKLNSSAKFVIPTLLALYWSLLFYQIYRLKKRIKECVVRVNQQFLPGNVLMGCTFKTSMNTALEAKLKLWYFDVQHCTSRIQVMPCNGWPEIRHPMLVENTSMFLIAKYCEEYTRDYEEGKLRYEEGFEPRHVRHVKCLCQYMEDLHPNKEDWIERLAEKLKVAFWRTV